MVVADMNRNPDYLSDPFTNVTIDRAMRGGTTVYWELTESFSDATPWTFTLQWSRPGDDWVDVGTTSDFALTDSIQRNFDTILDSFYQVKLVTGDDTYTSGPTSIPSNWNVEDLRKYNEARRQSRRLFQYRGVDGWVLFRRSWGTYCTDCVDLTTKEVTNSDCMTCYGTGFVDGYFAPYPIDCLFLGSEAKHVNEGAGDDVVEQASIRVAITPVIEKKDIIILNNTDKRYRVEDIKTEAHIKGYPAIEALTLTGLTAQDIIYDISWSGSTDPADGESEW